VPITWITGNFTDSVPPRLHQRVTNDTKGKLAESKMPHDTKVEPGRCSEFRIITVNHRW